MSTESSDLLAKSRVRMTNSKILGNFWDAGNFSVADFKFLGTCLVNIWVHPVMCLPTQLHCGRGTDTTVDGGTGSVVLPKN